ncbi:MAG: 16S rRNA (cytosine(1402)-N(4))-methyltransferase RsmH, partial [Clostridia bacterium]|nr:16S rRNA (cytosine(1402)-N(4))-methyltransferase RsmH [Clostridia bacterium]
MAITTFQHQPVLLAEVLEYLNPVSGGIYLDGTLGGGGHALEVLRLSSPEGCLLGIDRDIEALAAARQKLAGFGERLLLFQDNFVNLERVLDQAGIEQVDGILLDLGVSSYQLDNPERGFSYMQDAPLDMRMDQSSAYTAYQVVNELSEAELTRIIRDYGEERFASKIAAALKKSREPIRTTGQLAEIIKAAIPARNRREGPHPAKRTFQAIRIEVNRELEVIPQAILAGVKRLKLQGRLAV